MNKDQKNNLVSIILLIIIFIVFESFLVYALLRSDESSYPFIIPIMVVVLFACAFGIWGINKKQKRQNLVQIKNSLLAAEKLEDAEEIEKRLDREYKLVKNVNNFSIRTLLFWKMLQAGIVVLCSVTCFVVPLEDENVNTLGKICLPILGVFFLIGSGFMISGNIKWYKNSKKIAECNAIEERK